jgi:hypothetical protein
VFFRLGPGAMNRQRHNERKAKEDENNYRRKNFVICTVHQAALRRTNHEEKE